MTHFMNHIFTKTLPAHPDTKVDVVVGLDARGFLLGPLIAARLGAAFVPVRKRGKLPGQCHVAGYEKEYGVVSSKTMGEYGGRYRSVLIQDNCSRAG
jgi:adenine phosphoribosyltransferase